MCRQIEIQETLPVMSRAKEKNLDMYFARQASVNLYLDFLMSFQNLFR